MVKERKRGQRYPEGYIERRIAILVFDYPEGIEEQKIRDWVKKTHGVREKKGISAHLQKLKEKDFITLHPQKGKDNIWKPSEPKLKILKYVSEGMPEDNKGEVVSAFYTWLVQKTIEEYLLPGFLKSQHIIDGYFENGEFVYLTHLEREEPEEGEEGVIEPDIEPDVLNFFKKGFKLSPTALSHSVHELPEVKIATALILTAKPNYVDRGMDTRSIAVATLCSCLLIDMMKYPSLRDKIGDFFRDPDIARTLTTWLEWDFLHQRPQDWMVRIFEVGEIFR